MKCLPSSVNDAPLAMSLASVPALCSAHGKLLATFMLLLALSGTATVSLARDGDLKQPVDVRADTSEYDEQTGTQSLSGNVEIVQGSLRIRADRIDVYLKNSQLSRIVGTGSPIRFEQENNAGERIQGEARNIEYDAGTGVLILSGGATLQQPRQRLQSQRIVFDARRQRVSAEGNSEGERVNIRIEPPADVEERLDNARGDNATESKQP